MADELRGAGRAVEVVDAATGIAPATDGDIVLLTAIIWDRPIGTMRAWLDLHRDRCGPRVRAAGVVCGSAGVRPQGGMGYARRLVSRSGNPRARPFALAGAVPPRADLRAWEWWALGAFARAMGRPQLFSVVADEAGAQRAARDLRGNGATG